ncbi:MAG: dephospho-CoA kinase [Candidatus Omnitrophota bacterium]|jgi:dephospho-CoA kinase
MARKVIGVTGGLASGKTTIADMFAEKGAVKIDADAIAHQILENDLAVKQEVIDAFGEEVLTAGSVDRKKLAEKVFFDRKKLNSLSDILHPVVVSRIKEEMRRHEDDVVVIDAPLLIEAGLHEMMDIVIVVFADYETQLKRAADRGFSEETAKSIIAMQMPLAEKVKFADFTIDNSSDDKETVKQGVEKIWQKM